MYNRYIGNTGQFYRVEDTDAVRPVPPMPETDQWAPPRREQTPPPPPVPEWIPPPPPPPQPGPGWPPPPADPERMPPPPPESEIPPLPPMEEKSKFDLGAMFNMPGNLRGTLQGWVPESLDLGDILLVLVLIYLFLEGDDDDMLIILGVLAFTWIWPLFKRGEEA